MGTKLIIPKSDFSRNGLPLFKDVVFVTNTNTTVIVLFNGTTQVSVQAIAGEFCGVDCNGDFTSAANLLKDVSSIESIENLNTANITSFTSAFQSMANLERISPFIIKSICTIMDYAFYDCPKLKAIDMSNWELDGCNSFLYAFSSCLELTEIDMSGITIAANAILTDMFSGCTKLTKIKLPAAATPYRTMEMFSGCTALTEIDATQFGVPSTTQYSNMFRNCSALTTVKCNSTNYQFFIERLANAGYTFTADANYVLTKVS